MSWRSGDKVALGAVVPCINMAINGTKHSGGPPEGGREKRPKHVGVLYLQTRF